MHQLIPIVRFLDQLLMFVVIIKWVIECDRCTASRQLLRYQASLNLKYCFYEELFNIFKFCGVWIIWIFWRLYLLIKYILLGINCDLLSDLSHDPFLIVIIIFLLKKKRKKKRSFFRVNSSQLTLPARTSYNSTCACR